MAKTHKRPRPGSLHIEEEPSRAGHIFKEIILWFLDIVFAVALGWLLVHYGIERMAVSGSSMEGVLSADDSVIVQKITGRLWGYKRFDVIAFEQGGNDHGYYNIKRIVGLPGETVQIIRGKIYIDGEQLEDQYAGDTIVNAGVAAEAIQLEENEYFVLGDNRNSSEDSRFANIGNVVKSDIIGKVLLRLSPSFAVVPLLEAAKTPESKSPSEQKDDKNK